ncbi:CHAP domain-containing protein [Nocardioides sp.]|uniref:CHAP domain-containing protein n=1 Tax=Nocardioides sp. TaxID=35761 RepID=UPI00271AD3AF|nr:CHAP domain-containing protein [Nocardioides sp.]MDO9457134.1 CHAP domain-containing protein [Nocardioides sp.]
MTGSLASLLTAATLVAMPAGAPPSDATSTYLCTGYTACNNAGYSHAGYASHNRTMYWRMYAGHNCTNYVAYRMVQKGMPNERPWSGSGNATNWGVQMDDITDSTPAVGAVAWWRAGVSGAGSSGHVAYIERVVSSTEIVISEDSWSGDFHWRTIYKNGPGWPSGFIHFVDRAQTAPALTATATPRIEGTPQVGVPLRGYLGRFTPAGTTQALQWLVGGAAVAGATTNTYTPTAADAGKTVSLRSTGTLTGYTAATTTSTPTAAVALGTPVRGAKPGVAGAPEVDAVLTVVPGQWTPMPESTVYRWRADGVWLGAARNGRSLTVDETLVGKTISVVEVTKRAGYTSVSNASGNVGPVVEGAVELTAPFNASGAARHGSSLTFSPGTWTPADATATYEWARDGVLVPEATASTYPLGDADVGHRITVRATVSRDRYKGLTRSADFGVVTTTSTIVLRAGGRKRGAIARIRVTAPGVAVPTGTVWARVGDHVLRGTLVDGAAELLLTGLGRGPRTMFVSYGGNGVVDKAATAVKVIVKP